MRARSALPEPQFVAIALGGNVGDPAAAFAKAISAFSPHLDDLRIGPLYRTKPVSEHEQPDFLNTVIVGRTHSAAATLLALGKALELEAGRRAGPRNTPRPLDVDLLLCGPTICDGPELTLPHPRLRRRGFVLRPLGELEPCLVVPGADATVAELLRDLVDLDDVVEVPWPTRMSKEMNRPIAPREG